MSPGLLAERDGLPVAAIALTSGAVVADPRDPPEDAVRRLKFLRYRVMRQSEHTGAWRSLLRRAGSHTVAIHDTGFSGCRQSPEESRAISVVPPVADVLAHARTPSDSVAVTVPDRKRSRPAAGVSRGDLRGHETDNGPKLRGPQFDKLTVGGEI